MFTSSSTMKLLVWLFCVGAVVLVSQVQCRTLAGSCGEEHNVSNRRRRDAPDHRWPAGSNLTYRVGRRPSHGVLKDADIGGLITAALKEWAPHCGLHFTLIHSGLANISVSFESRAFWDFPIGLLGGIAYITEFPSKKTHNVEVLFADEEEWSLHCTPGSLELFPNLLHELGHALGLTHSDTGASIMYRYYRSLNGSSTLQNEDMARMRKLYDIADAYSGSVTDDVSHIKILSNHSTADVNQRSDRASTTTESSEGPFLSKNTTDLPFVEASTTESSEGCSKNTSDEYKNKNKKYLLCKS